MIVTGINEADRGKRESGKRCVTRQLFLLFIIFRFRDEITVKTAYFLWC